MVCSPRPNAGQKNYPCNIIAKMLFANLCPFGGFWRLAKCPADLSAIVNGYRLSVKMFFVTFIAMSCKREGRAWAIPFVV